MATKKQKHARLLILGPPRLEVNGKTVRLDTRKALALIAYLALNDQEYQRDTLTALLWPELSQSRARAALRRTLTPLNNALGPEGLVTSRETVALNPDCSLWVDSRAFEATAAELAAHGHDPREVCERCFEPLETGISHYRGEFMAGFTLRDSPPFDDWQFYEADRFRRLLAGFLELLAAGQAARGELDQALEHARRWLALDTLNEPAHRALMRIYAQRGERPRALNQYRECLRILDQELGVGPLEETTRLYEDILENRFKPAGAPRERAEPLPAPVRAPVESSPPFIGRTAAWSDLRSAYRAAGSGGRYTVIEGEIGIGKTRLMAEFFGYAQEAGGVVLSAQCYEGEQNLAYAPVQSALRAALNLSGADEIRARIPAVWQPEIARLLPEFGSGGGRSRTMAADADPVAAQGRLFEAVRRYLIAIGSPDQPAVLALDDLQWSDTATLDLLAYLVRRLAGLPVLILAAWRSENVPLEHPLRHLSAEALKSGAGNVIRLKRFTRAEVEELAAHFPETPAELRERLFERTEGLPFYAVEYLAAGKDAAVQEIPTGVREIQAARIAALDETSRQVITTAAVIGRSFDFETLKTASGRSEEETVHALEQLLARGLLLEKAGEDPKQTGPQGEIKPLYDFTHQTIHAIVYEQTSLARRRLLHRRVADALLGASAAAGLAGRIALHFHRTGMDEEAARYYRLAGDHARSVYANQEALTHYETALALGAGEADAIQEAIGDLLTLRGEYRAAVRAYERSAALGPPEKLPYRERKLAIVHHRRGDYDLAASHFQAALDLLPGKQSPGEARAMIHIDWSRTAAQLGDPARAQKLAQTGLQIAQQIENPEVESQAHNILGVLARRTGASGKARRHLESALATAGESLPARIAATNNLALVLADAGEFDESIALTRAALADCIRLGDRHREAALRNHLADRLHANDEQVEAMEQLKSAVEIFAEIGTDAGELQPEIWKLTEW